MSTFVNIQYGREIFRKLLSTFHATIWTSVKFLYGLENSVNFRQHSGRPGDLPSTFTNFLCSGRLSIKFQQLLWRPDGHISISVRPGDLPSTSVNIPCAGRSSIHNLLSTFCAAGRSFVNFPQLSYWPGDLPSISANLSSCQKSICTNFIAATRTFMKFSFNRDILDNFGQLSSTFQSGGSPSITFRQFSVWPNDLLSISANLLCTQETFL